MRWMLQYRANKCVFKSLRKLCLVTLGSLKLSGNEFQADGLSLPIALCLQPVSRTTQADVLTEEIS